MPLVRRDLGNLAQQTGTNERRPPDLPAEVRPTQRHTGPRAEDQRRGCRLAGQLTEPGAQSRDQEVRHRHVPNTGPRLRVGPDADSARGLLGDLGDAHAVAVQVNRRPGQAGRFTPAPAATDERPVFDRDGRQKVVDEPARAMTFGRYVLGVLTPSVGSTAMSRDRIADRSTPRKTLKLLATDAGAWRSPSVSPTPARPCGRSSISASRPSGARRGPHRDSRALGSRRAELPPGKPTGRQLAEPHAAQGVAVVSARWPRSRGRRRKRPRQAARPLPGQAPRRVPPSVRWPDGPRTAPVRP
jgi:hypothetical protein